MPIKRLKDNAQVQSLTSALKNICRDYPAGSAILRELLQNSDDAGATEVRFVLDDKTYNTDDLIDEALIHFQGPALKAYNDAVFTDKDFQNLSTIGESNKAYDGSTTDRHGRGFNSVYNWTDSPTILSRDRLLILEPHHAWSDGGNVYDVLESSQEPSMKNQLAAFSPFVPASLIEPFRGTVIRVPLRTKEQALHSKISNRETTLLEVSQALRKFSDEFGQSVLLFLKNIEKFSIQIPTGDPISIELVNEDTTRTQKKHVNEAVKKSLNDYTYSFYHSFEIAIRYTCGEKSQVSHFAVHHSIQSHLLDGKLKTWSHQQQLAPRVGLAIPLTRRRITRHSKVISSAFCRFPYQRLSQPIYTRFYSPSPGRARLHRTGDTSSGDDQPGLWNAWLLETLLPDAWTRLIVFLTILQPNPVAFEKWWP